jgi:hypothetical protein
MNDETFDVLALEKLFESEEEWDQTMLEILVADISQAEVLHLMKSRDAWRNGEITTEQVDVEIKASNARLGKLLNAHAATRKVLKEAVKAIKEASSEEEFNQVKERVKQAKGHMLRLYKELTP